MNVYYPFNESEIDFLGENLFFGCLNEYDYSVSHGLSSNKFIKWSSHLIRKFKNDWCYQLLYVNDSIIWDYNLVKSTEEITSSKDKLHLFFNPSFKFSRSFFDEMLIDVSHRHFSSASSFDWNLSFIDENIDLIEWNTFSGNDSVPWTESLIIKFKDKIEWNRLIQNKKIYWTLKLVNEVIPKEYIFSKRIVEVIPISMDGDFDVYDEGVKFGIDTKISNHIFESLKASFLKIDTWYGISANAKINWTENFIDEYFDKWDWELLSYNPSLPWSEKLIDKYFYYWNWNQISGNQGIIWNEKMIEKYGNKLRWATVEENKDDIEYTYYGIDNSPNLYISKEFILSYVHNWNWKYLTRNIKVEIDKDLLPYVSISGFNPNEACFRKIWNINFAHLVGSDNILMIYKYLDAYDKYLEHLEYEYQLECAREMEKEVSSVKVMNKDNCDSQCEDLPF